MTRIVSVLVAFLFSSSLLLADDGPKFVAKFEANYDKILPYRAELVRTIKSPEKGVELTLQIDVVRNKNQLLMTQRGTKIEPGDTLSQTFRNGNRWHLLTNTPDFKQYTIGPTRSLPGLFPADLMEVAACELREPYLPALLKGKLKSETDTEAILELKRPVELPGMTWTVHLAKDKSCVPTKSIFQIDGKPYLEIAIDYRELPGGGVFFPKQIEQTFIDKDTGKKNQTVSTEVRLMAFGKAAKADTIDPPLIPPGVEPNNIPDAEDESPPADDDVE